MKLLALDQLDLERSWVRVLAWYRGTTTDVPDRLPYELAARVWGVQPELSSDHDVQPIQVVMATKPGTQTVRPFVRPHVRDMLLYQALVDALRDPIEASLAPSPTVCSYRMNPLENDELFDQTSRWPRFVEAVRAGADEHPDAYALRADITSFFLTIDTAELLRELLAIGAHPLVVHDLGGLLTGWQLQGVRGLPQGLPPSGPLSNIYLTPLDKQLSEHAIGHWRYSDDFVVLWTRLLPPGRH